MGLTEFYSSSNKDTNVFVFGSDWIGNIYNNEILFLKTNIRLPSLGFNDYHFITTDSDKLVIFGNSSLLYTFNAHQNTVNRIILESPQSDRGGSSVFVDYEKNIWVSSLRGIYKLTQSPFDNLIKSKGLPEIEVSAISQFNSGEMVFGHNYGVTVIRDNKIVYHEIASTENTKTLISRITNIYHDELNDLMYLTSVQGGIFVLNKNGIIERKKIKDVRRYTYTSSYVKGGFVVFTDKGFYGFGNDLEYKIPNAILLRKSILYNDKEYLLGTSGGVFKWKFDENKISVIRNSSKLSIFSIYNENSQNFFFGTSNGIYKLKSDSIVKFNFNKQSINDPIYFIVQDSVKNFWLGTNNGVLKWDGNILKRYNKSDGLAGNETNRAAGFVDSKGNVWIGTDEGVSLYYGHEPDYSTFPPKVMLLDIKDHHNSSYSSNKNVSVDADKNNLTLHYRGLSFLDEKRNSFQIKLSEVDGAYYNEFTTQSTSARFNNLDPGNYIFSVRVKNSKDIWSSWQSSSIITIKKHFYDEPFFLMGIFGLFLFVTYSTYSYFQQKKYTQKLEKAVDLRTKDLKDTQIELITSIDRYKGIVESQSDLVVRINSQGVFTFVNDSYCSVFGKDREELIGKSFTPLVHPDDIERTLEEMKKLNYSPYRVIIEQRALTVDGYRWFSWEDYAIHDNNGNIIEIQAVGRDITLQKEIEIELEKRVKERTVELQSLIQQSPIGILTFDSEGFLLNFNNAAKEMFNKPEVFLFSNKTFNILSDEYLIKNGYKEKLLNLDSSNGFLLSSPIKISDADTGIYSNLSNHFLVYRIYSVVFDDENKIFVLLLDDITEQQKSEEVNKILLQEKIRISTIIKTIESERDRIARELHDGLGQLLTTAKLKLDLMKIKSDRSDNVINDTLSILINAGDEIRRIINDLKPSDVESFGLISSIEILCERVKQTSGINIQFTVSSNSIFDDRSYELIIYRIVQEALNNIVKHSYCSKAEIEIIKSVNDLIINISDDGIGVSTSQLEHKEKTFGIYNITERVKSLNGKIKIESEPNNGFKYHIEIPI